MKQATKRIISAYLVVAVTAVLSFGWIFYTAPHAKASFSYYRQVTINHNWVASSTSETYPNFAVMISSSTLDSLKTISNGGHVQNTNGYDIGFYTNSDCATGRLATERDYYASTSDTSVFWVKQASISTSTNTSFYMCYGDASVSTDPNLNTTYGATSTWDTNYKGVWHFGNGSSLSLADSTSNGNTLTNHSGTAMSSGQISGGVALNGSSQYLSVSTPVASVPLTISGWFQAQVSGYQRVFTNADSSNHILGSILLNYPGNGNATCQVYDGSVNTLPTATSNFSSASTWYYGVITIADSSHVTVYLNGGNSNNASFSGTFPTPTTLYLGVEESLSQFISGGLDEVRISNTARSADWIKTEYNNQVASSSIPFLTIGTEQSSGGGGAVASIASAGINILQAGGIDIKKNGGINIATSN